MTARGDKVEFELLVRPHLDALYRTALRLTRNAAAAEDIVQEACLKAFTSFDQFRRGTNFRARLFRILVNACIDRARMIGAERLVLLEASAPVPEQADRAHDPESMALARGVKDTLRDAIESLPAELRIVVLLVLVEEMSYAETAEALDVPVGTVRSRLHRARALLRSALSIRLAEDAGTRRPVVAPASAAP
jgi:RNA polymerase sigma-70 factor (ECF subfamily)